MNVHLYISNIRDIDGSNWQSLDYMFGTRNSSIHVFVTKSVLLIRSASDLTYQCETNVQYMFKELIHQQNETIECVTSWASVLDAECLLPSLVRRETSPIASKRSLSKPYSILWFTAEEGIILSIPKQSYM